jgi:hypothetical protein
MNVCPLLRMLLAKRRNMVCLAADKGDRRRRLDQPCLRATTSVVFPLINLSIFHPNISTTTTYALPFSVLPVHIATYKQRAQMSNQDLISMSQFLATLLPPDEQAQLDDENDKSLVKIPTLFFVATYLLSIYQTTGAAAALDKAIGYAQQLMTLLAALEHQPTHEPTAPTAAGLFMTLLEQKSNDSSDKHHYERLVEAAEDHLKLKQPQIPVHTQGTLAHALTQLYYRTYDSTILQRAIQETRDYLCIVETDHATATEEPVSNELLFGTRKNLVSCLAERHWSERDADSLCDLINECGRSLDLIPKQATEHGKVQEIMNFAVMAWYFRRLAPEWDMQGLFAESADDEVLDDEPKTSSESNTETLEQNFSSLSVSNNVYLDHVLHQGTKEIRILELLPGAQGSPLHCKLQVVDLQNHPEYNVGLSGGEIEGRIRLTGYAGLIVRLGRVQRRHGDQG